MAETEYLDLSNEFEWTQAKDDTLISEWQGSPILCNIISGVFGGGGHAVIPPPLSRDNFYF